MLYIISEDRANLFAGVARLGLLVLLTCLLTVHLALVDAILAANAHLRGGINSVQVNRLVPLSFTVHTQVEAVVTGDQVGGGGFGGVVI